jgi:sugar phosphate isomerase/epimerase
VIENVKRAGDAVYEEGATLLYHNHKVEIELLGDRPALSILTGQTNPETVKLELDTCFIAQAGNNPIEWLENYRPNFPPFL